MSSSYLVEVSRRAGRSDPEARRLARASGLEGLTLRLAWLFELRGIGATEAERVAQELLADPVLDAVHISPAPAGEGAWPEAPERVLTILRRPGVMDPVALSTVVAARELGIDLAGVRTARRFYLSGGPADAGALLARQLANAVVDRVLHGPGPLPAPAVSGPAEPWRSEVPLDGLDPTALLELSRARTLALDAVEMQAVQAHFADLGRAPSELELETIAQTWSEHCKHKTFAGRVRYRELAADGSLRAEVRFENLLQETVFAATAELNLPRCLSVFADNAGVIRFDATQGVAIKVETHNHPSAIEPYGGAGTGVGGVIRDILGTGLGARPVLNLDVFCVGDLHAPPEAVPPGALHPRELLAGVVDGVRDYGNRMGIPTVAGAVVSERRFAGNPLVYVGTVGLIPIERIAKRPRPGDWIVAVGGRTGRDGIHGATFSSDALHSESERTSGGAVQIGNPIAEKMLADVLLEVRERGWLRAVTDCGAGGFSSAVGEMAEGLGAEVDLAEAPLKYAGLRPWEVWISEAQERMVLAVPPEHGPELIAAFAAEDVEATRLGDFADHGLLRVRWGETLVGELDLAFLHDGLPRQLREAVWLELPGTPLAWPAEVPAPAELLVRLLGHPSVCSKEWIVRQYDHEVQGTSVLKPLVGVAARGPQDGVAVAPQPGSSRGIVLGLGINPRLSHGDPYRMATNAIDEALRNVVAAGGNPAGCALLDNFSWGDCRQPDRLGALVRAARACRDASLAFRAPFISGKDSLNNEYELPDGSRAAIPATLLVTAITVCEDVTRLVSMDLKGAGHPVYVVGTTGAELGGSLLEAELGLGADAVPPVDLARAPAILEAVHRAIATGGILAAHDLSEGGLAVSAAEMAFAGGVGLRLELEALPTSWTDEPEQADMRRLFAESPTRFLLEVDPEQEQRLTELLSEVPHARLGETIATPELQLAGSTGALLHVELSVLETAWRGPLFALYAH